MILWLLILYILLVSEFKGKVSVLLGRCCWRDIAVCLPALDTEALICMEEAVESKVTHSILLFFSAPPVHLNMIYTNQIKIDTGQRTTDQLIAKRLMLRINSLVIFQFTACIAWVVQGLVFFYGSHLFSEWFPGTQVGGIFLLSRSTLTKKSKRSTGVMCVRQKFGDEKINKVNFWEVLFFYLYLHGTLPSDDKCYHYNTTDNQLI